MHAKDHGIYGDMTYTCILAPPLPLTTPHDYYIMNKDYVNTFIWDQLIFKHHIHVENMYTKSM